MHVKPIAKLLGMLCVIGATSSCASLSEPVYPPHFRPWTVHIAQSYLYGVAVNEVYGVNYKEDWTSLFHKISRNSGYRLKDVRRALGDYDYDGVGLSLGYPLLGRQIVPTLTLPDQVYVSWSSYANENDYMMVLDVTPKMKAKMLEPHENPMGWDEPCYQSSFLLGLLPDGKAKVWLYGCMSYTYVGEFEPNITEVEEHPPTGDDNRANRVAKQIGATNIFPVPWERVNQVHYDHRRFKMDRLDDWEPEK